MAMWHGNHGYWPGMHWIWWVLFIVFVVWIATIIIRESGRSKGMESPLDILKRRYASGEIGKEEYEEKKRILEGDK